MIKHEPLIGFTIISHGEKCQLLRLIQALDREYDQPPIACHHDFSQSPIDVGDFGPNVRFVEPSIDTGWARFSLVEATLAALSLLYSGQTPDWFIHLSAADYPVDTGTNVRKHLARAGCDAFLDAQPVEVGTPYRCKTVGIRNQKLAHFDSEANRSIKSRFYLSREIWIPILRRKPKLRLGRYTLRPKWWRARGVFNADLGCYYGDFWFCANAKAAQVLLEPTAAHLTLKRHCRNRTQTDEMYFQTVLASQSDLTICLDNKRFAEWNGGGAHPMVLGKMQVDEALASQAFFARKFVQSSPILDYIDAALERSGASKASR